MNLHRFIWDTGGSSNRLALAVHRFTARSACLRAKVGYLGQT